ncbi:polyhydroxyalkanoate synthase [Kineosphaera limosa]|uniref:Putative polyhydroxyalkanoate synthase n=1 Tax=Kineosphaera limosa NBRC 100340 TaxID=1184609 RepID=K6W6D8_9MICO|nr:alpha/beta fold hydrolase [Kineosphaera limosa]NYD98919.1 polyhydroxyalkanoate synthase [Kineosphaera limosa]GAB94755.1 putative polyhydroxyalkanoate synthase [Kineosphaera limosa NBRC 100340]
MNQPDPDIERTLAQKVQALFPDQESVSRGLADTNALASQVPGAGSEVMSLWADLLRIQVGGSGHEPHPKDARFADPTWKENPVYRTWAQSYLAWVAMNKRVGQRLEDSGFKYAEGVKFAQGILTSALSPTNYFWGNPAAMKRAFETGGKSVVQGAANFVDDMIHNNRMPSMVPKNAFTVGEDLAVTPGAVVTRDEVAELIQYTPVTAKVRAVPTLVIPPPIGRYYFLDLAPGRSFVEYAVSEGLQMFMLSWRNPEKQHAAWNFDTYAARVIEAVEQIKEITGQEKVNVIGFCAGGLIESAALNKLAVEGRDDIGAASFAVMLMDWRGRYPMNAFANEAVLDMARKASARKGIFAAHEMGGAFTWLRPDDLVWNYWVNNYLMGKEPPAFDILAWNADGTRLPAGLHAQFLDLFAHSPMAHKDAASYLDAPFDAKNITVPVFVQGAVTDHLTPWQGTYRTTELVGSDDVTYVLSNAGHIASLVNPPANPKASYFTGSKAGQVAAADWQAGATKQSGSWWTEWVRWSNERSGALINAPKTVGGKGGSQLVPAPGRYVRDDVDAA